MAYESSHHHSRRFTLQPGFIKRKRNKLKLKSLQVLRASFRLIKSRAVLFPEKYRKIKY